MKKLIALILSLCMLVGMLPAMAETAAEAPAATERVDMVRLINQIFSDILNAVLRVDVKEAEANSATPESSGGNVFTILTQVLNNVADAMAKDGKENEDLNKLVAYFNDPETMKGADEKELDVLSSLVLLGIMAEAEERAAEQEADNAMAITVANSLLNAIYDGCTKNETLAAAVKENESRLFDMLLENNKHMMEYVEKNGALDMASFEVDEKAYAEFEAEIEKLEDYLKGIEGHKQGALDLLSLLHATMDDIHTAIDGHTHEDAKEVDHFALVGEMLSDLGEAISKVNLDEIREKTGGKLDTTGSVYAVLEKVIVNILADEAAKEAANEKESEESLNQILEMLSKLKEEDVSEEEAEAVFALMFLGPALSSADETAVAEQIDPEADFLRSSHILKAVYETMMENEEIKAALEATASRLPEMLANTGERLQKYVQEHGTLHVVEDVDEAPFVVFEAEFAKLRDYVAGLEDSKSEKALAVLDLLHEYVDDIHEAIDGHAHEDTAK